MEATKERLESDSKKERTLMIAAVLSAGLLTLGGDPLSRLRKAIELSVLLQEMFYDPS